MSQTCLALIVKICCRAPYSQHTDYDAQVNDSADARNNDNFDVSTAAANVDDSNEISLNTFIKMQRRALEERSKKTQMETRTTRFRRDANGNTNSINKNGR